jgi:hypothetical protein
MKLVGTHLDLDRAYDPDPDVDGPLNRIRISFAFKCNGTNHDGDHLTMAARALVRQGDHYFVSKGNAFGQSVQSTCENGDPADAYSSYDAWVPKRNFGRVDGPSLEHLNFAENPDFSATGEPLQFGFVVNMSWDNSIPSVPPGLNRLFLVDDFSFEADTTDADDDGLVDSQDNCIDVANEDQLDADQDDCGDVCDGDCTQDGVVGAPDYSLMVTQFGNNCDFNPSLDCACDLTSDAIVGAPDFSVYVSRFSEHTGPSGLVEGGECP